MEQNQGPSFIESLERNIRSILSIGAIVYAWGFIVAATNLSQYNVVSLSLLRIQYILAGIWVATPIIMFVIALFWFAYSIEFGDSKERSEKRTERGIKRLWSIFNGLISVFIALFVWYFLVIKFLTWVAPNIVAQFNPINTLDILKSLGFCFGIVLWAGVSWILARSIRDTTGRVNAERIILAVISASFAGLMVIGYTFFFATNIYPNIPSAFGGGQLIKVRFILAHDSNYESSREALHFIDNQEWSPTVSLVTTTENDYIIIDPQDSDSVILLPKNRVVLFNFE